MDNIRLKIMMVDDDPVILQTGRALLKDYYDVYPLPSADKLFEAMKRVAPDLILLDIKMPGIGGFETIKLLKADKRYEAIPVIFLTAANDRSSVVKGISLGAADFVLKPFSLGDLRQRIENQFNPKAARKPSILVVDDSSEILWTVFTILRDSYNVHTLPQPEMVEGLLESISPDLFILDYNMPVASGFDVIPVIRKYPKHFDTPIIIMTSEGTIGRLAMAVEIGVDDFIVKPFDADVLTDKVVKHMQGLQ